MLLGFAGKLRTKSSEDYALAGRKMPAWMATLSIAATLVGSGVTVGVGELGYSVGISSILYPTILGICLFFSMWLAAARFRKSLKYTIPEMLEDYYGPSARIIVAIIGILIFIPPTAAQFLVAGMILSTLTGISQGLAISIAAVVIIAYVMIGGMWAIGYTDAFQMLFIYLGLILLAIFSIIKFGGYGTILAQLPAGHSSWSAIGPIRLTAYLGVLLMFGFISQAWIQKSAAVETPAKAKWSGLFAGLLIFPIGFLAVFAGLIARITLPEINPAMRFDSPDHASGNQPRNGSPQSHAHCISSRDWGHISSSSDRSLHVLRRFLDPFFGNCICKRYLSTLHQPPG
jgi:SSS family solute:Na+ symporter